MSEVHSVNRIIFLLSVAKVELYGMQRNGSSLASSKEQGRSHVKLSMEKTHFSKDQKDNSDSAVWKKKPSQFLWSHCFLSSIKEFCAFHYKIISVYRKSHRPSDATMGIPKFSPILF